MLQKNKIILLGAIAVTFLMNFPRLLIIWRRSDFANDFGLTIPDVVLRSILLFGFAWLVLAFNVQWKKQLHYFQSGNRILKDILFNCGILLLGVASLTLLKQVFIPFFMDTKSLIFVSFFTYLAVHLLLLLFSGLVNLNSDYQKSLIEKEKAKQKALQHQLEALRNQINPHFLFNTLNSLNALVRQKSDKASTFVDKLSLLLRSTLSRSDQDEVTIEEELDYLNTYIFLQKERFGEKLNVDISIPKEWNTEKIPSFSLQLLVENAIKHNEVSNNKPLNIKIYTKNKFLIISNPIQQRRDRVESTGKGLSNLSTRFQLMKNEEIHIDNSESTFSVKLPIL